MDTNFNGTSGLGLPQPSADQHAADGVQPQQPIMYGQPAAVPADTSGDLDQEWVKRAKEIVDRTKGDPYAASLELSKVKADYLKNRYNKHIKVSED